MGNRRLGYLLNLHEGKIVHTGLRQVASEAKDKVSDIMTDIEVAAASAGRTVRGVAHRVSTGWDYDECWDFGSQMLARQAAICRLLSECAYDDPSADADYISKLCECADVFDVASTRNDLYDDVDENGVAISGNAVLDTIEDFMDDRFLPLWTWYGDEVMDIERFIKPVVPKGVIPRVARAITSAAGRATETVSMADVQDLPATELKRIGQVLEHLALYSVSDHPSYYPDKTLPGKDERWEDGTTPFIFLCRNDDIGEKWTKREGNTIRTKTRKEVGLGWCAWFEDLDEVKNAFDAYVRWYEASPKAGKAISDKHGISALDTMTKSDRARMIDRDTATKVADSIIERKRTCWRWLGEVGVDIWD